VTREALQLQHWRDIYIHILKMKTR
jgi:hypothetical protein